MSNSQNIWRIEFAQKLFQKIKAFKGLQAAFIGGSVCRGLADEYSDLELCFVWEKALEERQRLLFHAALEVVPFHLSEQKQNDILQIEESVHYNGFQIDVFHTTPAYIKAISESVLIHHDFTFQKLIYLNILQEAIPLCDNGMLKKWKTQIAHYPRSLAVKLIQTYIERFFKASMEIFLYREDWTVFYSLLAGYQKNIFLILTALNGIYFPGFKYSSQHIESMIIKPQGISKLYEKLYQLPPMDTWQYMRDLKLEVLQLVDNYFPEIATSHIYERLKGGRKKFAKPPIKIT